MLSIEGMRWYFATGLDCNSAIVDTLSLRAMITHETRAYGQTIIRYRNKLHCASGPAEAWYGGETWYRDGKMHRLDGPAYIVFGYARRSKVGDYKEWWINGVRQPRVP